MARFQMRTIFPTVTIYSAFSFTLLTESQGGAYLSQQRNSVRNIAVSEKFWTCRINILGGYFKVLNCLYCSDDSIWKLQKTLA